MCLDDSRRVFSERNKYMTEMRTALVGWKKGMTSIAHTYMVEVEGSQVHFTRIGKGGAHWEPDLIALGLRAAGANPQANRTYTMQHRPDAIVGATVARGVGEMILGKYRDEIVENIKVFESEGRGALAHKANVTVPTSEIAAATPMDKFPRGGPPALKDLDGMELNIGGKQWFLFRLPDTPELAELVAAAAS